MISRAEEAAQRKSSGKYNCAQAVACTYCDLAGCDEETMASITAAFGTGMGNMQGTCGALIGAAVVTGMIRHDRNAARSAMKGMMDAFALRNGSVTCRDLKGIGTGKPLRSCNDCVADAAKLLESYLEESSGQ